MTKAQKEINARFLKVCDRLVESNLVRHKTNLAQILGTYSNVMSRIKKGESTPTLKQLEILFKTFGVDANYIFGKSEYMFLNSTPTQHKKNELKTIKQKQ